VALGPSHADHYMQAAKDYLDQTICPKRKLALAESTKDLSEKLQENPENRFITFCLKLGPISWFNFNYDASPLWEGVSVNMPIMDRLWGQVFKEIDITKNLKDFKRPVLLCLGLFDYLVAPFFSWYPIKEQFHDLKIKIFEKSSHTPQFEESENFQEVLLNFLSQK
jgi:proline iminopeptidase